MPIDAGIYSQQILPPALDPAKIQAGVIAQQDQLDAAKAKQQDVRDSLLARSIWQSTGGDPDKAIPVMRSRGLYAQAEQAQKDHDATAKANQDLMTAKLKNESSMIDRASSAFQSALNNPGQAGLDTLKNALLAIPVDPDDPNATTKILADIGDKYDPATTPAKYQQYANNAITALDQQKQQLETLDRLFGKDHHVQGAMGFVSDAADASDYATDYASLKKILPLGAERDLILSKLPDPSQVTDANFGQVKQALVTGSMTPQEQTNRMNAETAAENAKKEPAGFTLGQGQTRFDAQGNKVASVAPRPIAAASQSAAVAPSDAKAVAQAIMNGDQPPEFTGLYRNTMAVRAELAKAGYPLTKATEDWTATKKYLTTLNGQQQTRLRQAVTFASDSLGLVQSLSDEWQGGRFPLLNKANLAAAKSGAYGKDAQSLATRLEAQIADLTSELGTVYKGGNSSTDESLKLAATNLSADWSQQTLSDSIKQIRQNLQIRQNSIANTGTAGTGGNQYDQQRAVEALKSSAPALIYDPKTGTFKKGGGS